MMLVEGRFTCENEIVALGKVSSPDMGTCSGRVITLPLRMVSPILFLVLDRPFSPRLYSWIRNRTLSRFSLFTAVENMSPWLSATTVIFVPTGFDASTSESEDGGRKGSQNLLISLMK